MIANDVNNTLCDQLMPPGMADPCYNFLTHYGAMLRHDVLKLYPIHERWCEDHPHDPCAQAKHVDKALCALLELSPTSTVDDRCVGPALRRRLVRAGVDVRACATH